MFEAIIDNCEDTAEQDKAELRRRLGHERNLTRYLEAKVRRLESAASEDGDMLLKPLPKTKNAQVLRTDFSDDMAWQRICDSISEPSEEGFEAYVEFVDDREFAGLTKSQILSRVPADYGHSFLLIVDRISMESAEQAVLVINLQDKSGQEFRAIPSQIQAIENNLSIANMDFAEFAAAVDADGVFRGFEE